MIYVDVSGGCDSTAICLLYKERGLDFELLFADTGAELPENYWFLPQLAKYCGKKLNVVNNGGMFFWLVKKGYYLPTSRARWCTQKLKTIPMAQFHGNQPYSHAIGIRADEPKRVRDEKYWAKGEEILYPLVEAGMDKTAVIELCKKHGMLNPAYRWRTSVSCFCCPFQKLQDWKNLYTNHPGLFMIAEKWEEMSNQRKESFNWRRDRWSLKAIREVESYQLSIFQDKDKGRGEFI